jgi:hypothetical protein
MDESESSFRDKFVPDPITSTLLIFPNIVRSLSFNLHLQINHIATLIDTNLNPGISDHVIRS